MIQGIKKRALAAAAITVVGLVGCGVWVWTGFYTFSGGSFQADTTIAQPNPLTVNVDATLYWFQLGHATCTFLIADCTGTVNIGTDSWHVPGCNVLSQDVCIGYNPGDTFVTDLDGVMQTQTGGTVDTYNLTVSNFAGLGPLTLQLAR
jgi:hypothetical protein